MGGLMSCPGLRAIADEPAPMPDIAVPREPVPESVDQDPPVSLREAIAQGRIVAKWVATAPNQLRLALRNTSDRNAAVRIDPGTTLTDGKARWLAGSPSRFEGAFGGAYVFEAGDAQLRSSTIPVPPGRETALTLPALRLTASEPGSKIDPANPLTSESLETWSTDKSLQAVLLGLSMLGSSLPVAQGIAWRAVEAKDWKAFANLTVQGRILNEFEKHAVDRYLAEIAKIGPAEPEVLRNSLLAGLMDVQIRQSPGKDGANKRFAALLDGRSLLGQPLGKVSSGKGKSTPVNPMRLEFAIVEVFTAEPLRLVVDVSLSTHTDAPGGSIRWARTRLTFGTESSDQGEDVDRFLDDLTTRFAYALVRTERTGTGSMFSRFRLENRSPWTLSDVALRTGRNDSDPAVWPLEGLGLSPRGRTIVPVPADRAEPVDLRWSPI
jgi:hypothetical protein